MKQPVSDIALLRRAEIVEAAVGIIVEQGLHNLSLSEIETRAGMSRGQLTYYFPAKEDILLAVFDRMLTMSWKRLGPPPGVEQGDDGRLVGPCSAWTLIQYLFQMVLLPTPFQSQEFHTLQYTFLSQVGYREDFRRKLATLYEEWRGNMAHDLSTDLDMGRATRRVPARAMASLIQALIHGLAVQTVADPNAFDKEEMLKLCLDLLGTYLGVTHDEAPAPTKKASGRRRRVARPDARR